MKITRRALMRCSFERAGALLRRFACERKRAGSAAVPLAVEAPVWLASLDAEIVLRRPIVAAVRADPDAGATAALLVTWQPVDGTAFPSFRGHMSALAAVGDAPGTCWLQLEGVCAERAVTLRLCEPGERAIGHRLAVAVARRLLRDIIASIELLDAAQRSAV